MKSIAVWFTLLLYFIPRLYNVDITLKPVITHNRIHNLDKYLDAFYFTNEVDDVPKTAKDIPTSPMELLDKVKSIYADNFEKVYYGQTGEEYYYKLPVGDYYLVYEGLEEDQIHYLYHLYEFVLDDLEEGIGHTVTYGWYRVNSYTGLIDEQLYY